MSKRGKCRYTSAVASMFPLVKIIGIGHSVCEMIVKFFQIFLLFWLLSIMTTCNRLMKQNLKLNIFHIQKDIFQCHYKHLNC